MREVSSKSVMVTCRPLVHLSRNDPEVSFKKWLPQTVTWNFEVGSFFPERMFQDVRYANAKLLAAEGLWASQGPRNTLKYILFSLHLE